MCCYRVTWIDHDGIEQWSTYLHRLTDAVAYCNEIRATYGNAEILGYGSR